MVRLEFALLKHHLGLVCMCVACHSGAVIHRKLQIMLREFLNN